MARTIRILIAALSATAAWAQPQYQDRMKQRAASPKLIIPGHDPALMTNLAGSRRAW